MTDPGVSTPEDLRNSTLGGGESLPEKSATASKRTKSKGSIHQMSYGTRLTKCYPITETELANLFGIGLIATVCFSLSLSALSFGVDLWKDISISRIDDPYWKGLRAAAFISGIVIFIAGVVALILGSNTIADIKRNTQFKD